MPAEASTSAALSQLVLEGTKLECAALAPSTSTQYAHHMKYWWRFLLVFGLAAYLHSPSEGALYLFAAFLARTCTAATVRQYLKGVKHFYDGIGVQLGWAQFTRLQRLLSGLKRLRGEGTHRKLPITPPMLLAFHAVLPMGTQWLAVFTCCVIGVFGMLRRSNLVVGGVSLFGQAKHITRGDVRVDPVRYALCITVRFSKTLRYQDRVHEVWIVGDRSAPLDPVAVWLGYLAAVPAPATAPAFCFLDAHGALCPLTYALLADGIKGLVAAIGLDPTQFATHSLRRGGATYSFQAGALPTHIKFAGDWASDAFELYLTMGVKEKLACTAAMLVWLRREGLVSGGA
jgi:hypothetical protein